MIRRLSRRIAFSKYSPGAAGRAKARHRNERARRRPLVARGLTKGVEDAGGRERYSKASPPASSYQPSAQLNALSIPAIFTPVKAEASKLIARRSSTSRLWTEDLPQAFASAVISIVIAVR